MQETTHRDTEIADSVRRVVRDALDAEATKIELLPAALGLRRFARVTLVGGPAATLVARVDAAEDPAGRPPGIPPEPPLEPLRALLERCGLPVPACYGADEAAGIQLLEDAGNLSLCAFARDAAPAARRAIYAQACDLVPRMQRVTDPSGRVAAFERQLDATHFRYKAELFSEWSLPQRGRAASAGERTCVREAFALIADESARAPQRLAHRDLQSANIYVLPGRAAAERLMLIDLQGALLAPPEYDLVCLLRDSYVALPEQEIEAHLARVRPQLPDAPEAAEFARRFDLLALARKAKDHARFLYAAGRRGDERYLAHLPVTARQLRAAAERSAERDARFTDLAELIGALPEHSCAR
jgi:aminoglycoside/choline kinase family phosphotransferase